MNSAIGLCFLFAGSLFAESGPLAPLLAAIERAKQAYQTEFGQVEYEFDEISIMQFLDSSGKIEKSDTTFAVVIRKGKTLVSRKIFRTTADTTNMPKSRERALDFQFSENNPDYRFEMGTRTDSSFQILFEPTPESDSREEYVGHFWFSNEDYRVLRFEMNSPKPAQPFLKEIRMHVEMVRLQSGLNVVASSSVEGKASAFLGMIKKHFRMSATHTNFRILRKPISQ